MNEEYVYLLTNPCMPEYVKVGRTTNLKERLSSLSRDTSVPVPFSLYAYITIKNGHKVTSASIEKNLHRFLAASMQKNKEFFKTTPDKVLEFFKGVVEINPSLKLVVCNENKNKLPAKSKAVQTTFALLGIPVGSVLVHKDDSSIWCKVADDKNQVIYKNKPTTLSAICRELMGHNANGYLYFTLEGSSETLIDRKVRLGKN